MLSKQICRCHIQQCIEYLAIFVQKGLNIFGWGKLCNASALTQMHIQMQMHLQMWVILQD